MSTVPSHIGLLYDTGQRVTTPEGRQVVVLGLKHLEDGAVLSAWAKHFREHYQLDAALDEARDGTGLSRKDYLGQLVFPDKTSAPGPSIRAGDFAEILVADYFEYTLHWRVPRTRYRAKAVPNESVKGSDFLAFGITTGTDLHGQRYSADDVLMSVEVKAQFSGASAKPRLQNAVDDSAKDRLRRAYLSLPLPAQVRVQFEDLPILATRIGVFVRTYC